MMKAPQRHLHFGNAQLPDRLLAFRQEIREFLETEREAGTWEPNPSSWGAYNQDLTRKMGERGWIGLTWPKEYGGAERSYLDRYVLTEELLAAGAPAGAHWVADRQSGPLILNFGTEHQKQTFLPPITRGESYFCIGMSEPDSGSDLASIRSRATKVDGGYRLSGTKIWTSWAHNANYIITLCRTEAPSDNRHAGMSQLVVDLASDGIQMSGITNIAGQRSFNEIVFDEVFVPDDCLLGEEGNGWAQCTSELAYERSGPERFLTNFLLFRRLLEAVGDRGGDLVAVEVGRITSRIWALRQMAISVASMLEAGESPVIEASFIKDLGTALQQELPELARLIADAGGTDDPELAAAMQEALLVSPAYTIQGGTTEILRGIIARGLKLR